jgi:hypothetical protein
MNDPPLPSLNCLRVQAACVPYIQHNLILHADMLLTRVNIGTLRLAAFILNAPYKARPLNFLA